MEKNCQNKWKKKDEKMKKIKEEGYWKKDLKNKNQQNKEWIWKKNLKESMKKGNKIF